MSKVSYIQENGPNTAKVNSTLRERSNQKFPLLKLKTNLRTLAFLRAQKDKGLIVFITVGIGLLFCGKNMIDIREFIK